MARCGCCRCCYRCCVVHSTLLVFVVVVLYVINIDFNLLLPHSKLISVNNCSASGPPSPLRSVLYVFWSVQYAKKVKIELGRSIGSGRERRYRRRGFLGRHRARFYFSSTFALTWRRLLLLVIQLTFSLNTQFHPHTTPSPPHLMRDRRPSNLLTQFGPYFRRVVVN